MTSTTVIPSIHLHPDGRVLSRGLSAEDTGTSLCNAIGCDLFDVVSLQNGIDLFVDDEGIPNRAPLNLPATVLAHVLGSRAVLFGVAVAVSVNAEGDTIGLTDQQRSVIVEALQNKPDATTLRALAESLAPFPSIVERLPL